MHIEANNLFTRIMHGVMKNIAHLRRHLGQGQLKESGRPHCQRVSDLCNSGVLVNIIV